MASQTARPYGCDEEYRSHVSASEGCASVGTVSVSRYVANSPCSKDRRSSTVKAETRK